MTGMTAQARGADDAHEVDAMLARGLGIGLALGIALAALQLLLIPAAFGILAGGADVDTAAKAYVSARFIGAPAALAVFAINGWLLGLGRTRAALALSVLTNLVNIAACALFVWQWDMGPRGVGLGTAVAEWTALAAGVALVAPHLQVFRDRARVFDRVAFRRLFAVNADIMIRTIALLTLFAWFTNAGARLGAETLAANQILMQAVALVAFALDGFAFTAEARVGHAIGARSRPQMLRAIRLTGEFSLATAIAFGGLIALAGAAAIPVLTTNAGVRHRRWHAAVRRFLPVIGMPSWLLDGMFIGATEGRALRNAAILATALYVATDLALRPWGDTGVWLALLAGYVFRAAALGAYLPRLLAKVT